MKWQPIETAPKDGTRILTFSPNATKYRYSAVDINYWEGAWRTTNTEMWPPTHWMPLPAPPSS